MANRLERILAMDEAVKARNAPKAGTHKVVNADGTVTEIPYMEDRRGRRTVMTASGPKVMRGHEGKNLPGEGVGRAVRNVLGGLFGKGGVPGGTPPFVPAKEDYFDMSKLGSKSKTALSRVEMGDGSILIQESSTDAQGNSTVRFIDPNSGTQIGQTITTGLGIPKASVQNVEQSSSGNASPTVNPSRNRFGATVKPLNATEQKIQDFLPEGVSVDGRLGTRIATPAERQAARTAADKKPIKRPDVDYSAALLLSEDEAKQYMSGTLSDEDFRKLHNKAMTTLAKEPKKKTEGIMKKERAFSQMTLAMPTLAKYEQDPKFIEKISGASGAMARNWRATGDDDEKMYLQAADAWVRAKLRDESGAAIGVDEMKDEYATFFPQYGDTPELIAEKAKQRGILTEQMGSASGVIDSTDTPETPEADLTPLVVGKIEIVEIKEKE